jgi:hypothetical protein
MGPADAGIIITGTRPDFYTQVRAALKLLKEEAPDDYRQIEKDIGMIKEVEAWHLSGMNPFADPPTFSLSITTVRISVTWCAGAIAQRCLPLQAMARLRAQTPQRTGSGFRLGRPRQSN